MFTKYAEGLFDEVKKEILKNKNNPTKSLKLDDSLSNNSEHIRFLENKFDLKPTDYIAKGQYNIVYSKNNLIYKFTKNRDDVLKPLAIFALRNEVPEKFYKHILHIEDFGHIEEISSYYLIVEKLYPISRIERSLLLANETFDETAFISTLLITEENYNNFINSIKENALKKDQAQYLDVLITDNKLKPNLMHAIKNAVDNLKFEKVDFGNLDLTKRKEKILANASNFASTVLMTILKYFKGTFRESLSMNFNKVMSDVRKPYLANNRMPKNAIGDTKSFREDRFGKELLDFLNYLKNNNIYFFDVHTNNIMKRSNGDLVLSDVGLFNFR